jgi:hypothetical protein
MGIDGRLADNISPLQVLTVVVNAPCPSAAGSTRSRSIRVLFRIIVIYVYCQKVRQFLSTAVKRRPPPTQTNK